MAGATEAMSPVLGTAPPVKGSLRVVVVVVVVVVLWLFSQSRYFWWSGWPSSFQS